MWTFLAWILAATLAAGVFFSIWRFAPRGGFSAMLFGLIAAAVAAITFIVVLILSLAIFSRFETTTAQRGGNLTATSVAVVETPAVACPQGQVCIPAATAAWYATVVAKGGSSAPTPTATNVPPTATTAPRPTTTVLTPTRGAPATPKPGTFNYVPGGEGFGQVATDVTLPRGETNCMRVWQATNLVNLPWTFILCNFKATQSPPKMQWPHPTLLTVSGTGTVEFDLYRDLGAVQQLKDRGQYTGQDPYDVANAQKSPLGLGWFVQGFNGTVVIDGVSRTLEGGGVHQLAFPKDWIGHHHVVITVNNGQVQFWQGEKMTSVDTWPAK